VIVINRRLNPLAVAAALAVASCGLLALAIVGGRLGADVGRGANFCEAAREGLVRQPANTFSNLGFVLAGLLIAWHARGLESRRGLATAFACLVVLLGPGSAAMHATQTALGGHLDMASMYVVASAIAAYAATRWLRRGAAFLAVAFAGGLILCELVGAWAVQVPVVMTAGNAIFGLLLVVAVVLEGLMMRRGSAGRRGFAFASVATILAAFAIWNAARAWLCDPHSLLQGHAAWHLLGAVAAYLLYRYYASERRLPQAETAASCTLARDLSS
jgi:hypothetical protein